LPFSRDAEESQSNFSTPLLIQIQTILEIKSMFKGLKKYTLPVISAILLSATFLFAQVTGGAVTGSVVDAAEAVIPNASVKLESKARGQVITTQTTSSGSYLFPNVPVGEYTITFEQSGFANTVRELVVSLNQTTTVDATLQVSGATNVVDVTTANEAIVQ
jgi:hypothetical protein